MMRLGARVLATDLPDAMELLGRNLRSNAADARGTGILVMAY